PQAAQLGLVQPARPVRRLVGGLGPLHGLAARQRTAPGSGHRVGAADLGCRRPAAFSGVRRPHSVAVLRDTLDAPAREDAFGTRVDDLGGVAGSGRRIALLDQQPVLLVVAPARAPRKADERPAPAELLAVQRELELALSESL